MSKAQEIVHNAEAAALGFYYQAYFALETLLLQTADDAAVAVERLDDVELVADGQTLLFQLKHSLLPSLRRLRLLREHYGGPWRYGSICFQQSR